MLFPGKSSPSTAVFPATAEQETRAALVARKLSIPLLAKESMEFEFLLICSAAGLALKKTDEAGYSPITVDFASPSLLYRVKHGGGRRQALARAVGLKKNRQPRIIDATAGLGRDGFILASLGCHVLMVERSQILAVMLEDGLERAARSKETAAIINNRLELIQADSRDFLEKLRPEDLPDVIYLDPMYPERTKSSLVKKEMRLLRRLTGTDQDAEELLDIATVRARSRVVVKRPRLAAALGRRSPSHQIAGQSSRFDVYLV